MSHPQFPLPLPEPDGLVDQDPLKLRPTWAEIDLDALVENYRALSEKVRPSRVMAVLKADAYGHGLVECARALEAGGATSFGVALLEEGIRLRQAGVSSPILVMGGIAGSQIHYFLRYGLEITASSVSKLEAVDELAERLGVRAQVHLKIDTGMERIGVHHYSAESLLERSLRCRASDIVGIFSHFSTVKDGDLEFAHLQLERFHEVLRFYERRSLKPPVRHMAASAAVFSLPESHLDMVRTGVALYGSSPSAIVGPTVALKPVLKLRSQIVYFKVVKKGAGVSYGRTWIAPQDTRIVTVPLGYADGYMRRLSNVGEVLIRGKRYPVIGTVCMDQVMVDIGNDEAFNGEEVVLIGSQGGATVTVNEIAEKVGTCPHEVTTVISARVPRRYVRSAQ